MKGDTQLKVFLWICAVLFLPYGLYCFAQPGALEEIAGVAYTTPTGGVELRAMYGGLQTAVGTFALMGALRAGLARPAALTIVVLCAGLGLARLSGALLGGTFAAYTLMGLGLEFSLVGFGYVALGGMRQAEGAHT